MTLRTRMALLTAVAVALAVAACATASWYLTRDRLYDQLDDRLGAMSGPPSAPQGGLPPRRQRFRQLLQQDLAQALKSCRPEAQGAGAQSRLPGTLAMTQVVNARGQGCTLPGAGSLGVTHADAEVARGERDRVVHDGAGVAASGGRARVRVLTRSMRMGDGETFAVSFALSLNEVEDPLGDLAVLLVAVTALGVLVSAGAGLLTARTALRPVEDLTGAVEYIARTEDLGTRIPVDGTDEIARLSLSFNSMTGALAASRERQWRLIADAGHELRTPLTSLRTNIDLLLRADAAGRDLPAGTRREMLASVKAQMVELSSLVGDLLELARPDEAEPVRAAVALHEVVDRAVERARPRGPGLVIEAFTTPWHVAGDPGSLERAVVNLLDNAIKFSPPGETVTVLLRRGELTVRDRGPGIPAEDLPHVFERFWRSPSARSLPGSGLGLSIVARVVCECGGKVVLEPADGGGTLARVRLPGTPRRPA
ncbi:MULTISPECIES: HAMP domain-containing sensor histidine kinase [Actinomadura]|nr:MULTISPECIES: HAMP domain-containing sensor histidine kinase [Actinomadura]